jgi:hypothetical protein
MMATMMRSLIVLLIFSSACVAFQPLGGSRAAFRPAVAVGRTTAPLYMSSSSGKNKRRRTRRVPLPGSDEEEATPAVERKAPAPEVIAPPPAPDLKPRADETVEFRIQDVRDVLSGKTDVDEEDEEEDDDEDDDDDDEWEYVDINEEEDNDEYEYVIEDASGKKLDSLEQLLADARALRVDEDKRDEEREKDNGISLPDAVLSGLSTIVTIDFFVVIGLLLWFLAGIFGQYVLKDEAIQIAFNNIFEPVVQPALGVLMIGSAAGAVFRKEEEDELMN